MGDIVDIAVIGSGPGGHAVALQAASQGAQVVVIEKDQLGGTCTNKGCVPTKVLLNCSSQFSHLKKVKRMGCNVGKAEIDFVSMKQHQEHIVKISALGVQKSLKDAGVTIVSGEGRIVNTGQVECTDRNGSTHLFAAKKIVIAWGSEPAMPIGVQRSQHILTSDELLSLKTLPESVVIVGGSVIGIEFATFLAEVGVQVTIVELLDRLLPNEEKESSLLLTQELKKKGVTILTSMRMEQIRDTAAGVTLHAIPIEGNSGSYQEPHRGAEQASVSTVRSSLPLEISADMALISTGRKPRLYQKELDSLGIKYGSQGVIVDDQQETSVKAIYAIGDVTGGIMLAHRAIQQGKALASKLLGISGYRYSDKAIPSVVYSHPQVARVGMTEKEARADKLDINIHQRDFGSNVVARASLMSPGFVKFIFGGDRLIGATVACDQAGELIASLSLALAARLTREQLMDWIIPHPSLSEILTL